MTSKGRGIRLFVGGVLLILTTVMTTTAQDPAAVAEQQAETLRAQLREAADKEAQLQERVQQLDEELRPENIQLSVAGTGTTDARALREQRRQQLERQKAGVEEQLRSLAASRARLEAAIAGAEAEAVRLRAAALEAKPAPPTTTSTAVQPAGAPAAPAVRQTKKTRPAVTRRNRKARRRSR